MTIFDTTLTETITKSHISIKRVKQSRIDTVDLENPGFGVAFADHMVSMCYENGHWNAPEIIPFGDISTSPAMAALHYGQTAFEGMKAFRSSTGDVQLFRPLDHFKRLNNSCRRMCVPEVDPHLLLDAVKQLISLDQKWVPSQKGTALYVRPIIFAEDAALGVRPAQRYRLLVITSPVGAYYKEGIKPVSLMTMPNYIRAAKGGTGFAKTGCNYGPTLLPARQAQQKGFTQVLWLDAKEHAYIEEVGTMNIFFKIDGALYTPPLSDSILGGITRDSAIELAKQWGISVIPEPIHIDDIFEASKAGSLEEIFGTGTAAVISPVGSIHHNGKTLVTNEERIGPFAQKLYNTITNIQYGVDSDGHGWMIEVGSVKD